MSQDTHLCGDTDQRSTGLMRPKAFICTCDGRTKRSSYMGISAWASYDVASVLQVAARQPQEAEEAWGPLLLQLPAAALQQRLGANLRRQQRRVVVLRVNQHCCVSANPIRFHFGCGVKRGPRVSSRSVVLGADLSS